MPTRRRSRRCSSGEERIGLVTSGGWSPTFQASLALAYLGRLRRAGRTRRGRDLRRAARRDVRRSPLTIPRISGSVAKLASSVIPARALRNAPIFARGNGVENRRFARPIPSSRGAERSGPRRTLEPARPVTLLAGSPAALASPMGAPLRDKTHTSRRTHDRTPDDFNPAAARPKRSPKTFRTLNARKHVTASQDEGGGLPKP